MLSDAFMTGIQTRLAAIRQMPKPIPANERFRYTIKNVEATGFIRFNGKTYLVEEVGRYQEKEGKKTWTWQELKLFCLDNGQTVYLEWEEDDEIEIYLTTEQLTFADLRDDANGEVDSNDLDQIVDDEDCLFYKGKRFNYDDDSEAQYYRKPGAKGEKVALYEFAATDGTCLTIEEWGEEGNEEYQIFLSQKMAPKSITVFAVKANA